MPCHDFQKPPRTNTDTDKEARERAEFRAEGRVTY